MSGDIAIHAPHLSRAELAERIEISVETIRAEDFPLKSKKFESGANLHPAPTRRMCAIACVRRGRLRTEI